MTAVARTRGTIDVHGGELYFERLGEGPSLLLLHGWAMDHRVFRSQWEHLSEDFDVIAFDRRGFGRSTAPPDLRREVDNLRAVMGALDIERPHLLGMSQGGRVALRFVAEQAAPLASLLLQGPVVDGLAVEEPEAERIPVADYAALARAGEMDKFRDRWRAHPMMDLGDAGTEARDLLDRLLADYEGRDLVAFEAAHYAYPGDVLDRLAAFRQPVLVLTGSRETRARKAHAERLLHTFPDAREAVLQGCGHLSNLEAPNAYNALVRRFCLGAATL